MIKVAAVVFCLVLFRSNAVIAQNYSYGVGALSLTPQAADKMVELGAGTVRLSFGWDVIEPDCKGCFDWSVTDAWRDEARRTNLKIYGLLAYTPRWANGGRHYSYPPLSYQDWYDFVYAVVERYRTDIFQWGIWNEPNLDHYLHDGDLDAYQMLVSTARTAIKAANPDANVLGPEVSLHAIRDGWYAAAMQSFGNLFDIVTVRWYYDGPQGFRDGPARAAVCAGEKCLAQRDRHQAVLLDLWGGRSGDVLQPRAERVPATTQLVDDRALLQLVRSAHAARLWLRNDQSRLVQSTGVLSVSGVH